MTPHAHRVHLRGTERFDASEVLDQLAVLNVEKFVDAKDRGVADCSTTGWPKLCDPA